MQKKIRKTRIIATIGPASRNKKTITSMFEQGVNVIRLNASHGSHKEHGENIKLIRETAVKMNLYPGILLDLQGPKIRTGKLENGEVVIKAGERITFTGEELIGNKNKVSISYKNLEEDISVGNKILLDDGLMDVVVEEILGKNIICKIITGGILKEKKGVNLPGAKLSISTITEKDKEDIKFGIKQDVDFIALSFVRSADDIRELKNIISFLDGSQPVIAKIEKGEALDDIDAIIEVADIIMVARGDLGVETAPENVPLDQITIINKCNMAGKPVIVATQMLESMINNPRPTRAESTDVANAVIEGVDGVMLSGETAAGKYPVEAVEMMNRIIRKVEDAAFSSQKFKERAPDYKFNVAEAISKGIITIAESLPLKYIVTFTSTGKTAKLLSKYRSQVPIIAMTQYEKYMRLLSIFWGVHTVKAPKVNNTDEIMTTAHDILLEQGYVKKGDLIALSTGVPLKVSGTTNMIRVMEIDVNLE